MADIKDELKMSPKNKEKVKRMYADEMILEAIGNVFGFTKQYIFAIIKFSGNKQELVALNKAVEYEKLKIKKEKRHE